MVAHLQTAQPNRPRLGCESLEQRDNPAGNVLIGLFNNILYVQGDAADNHIVIQQHANGIVAVHGFSGTTVNGQSAVNVGVNLSGVEVGMGFGNDVVQVGAVNTAGWFRVGGGVGDDLIAFHGVAAGGLVAYGDVGNDLIVTDNLYVWGYAELNGGAGYDVWQERNGSIAAGSLYQYWFEERTRV